MGAADGYKVKIVKFRGCYTASQVPTLTQTSRLSISVGHGIAGIIQNAGELHFAATLKNLKLPGEMVGSVRIENDIGTGLELQNGRNLCS